MKLKLKISSEMKNHLQRLGLDIDTRTSVINNMFEMHKDDTDTSVFDSVPWKKYHEELEKTRSEYELTKTKFSNEILKPAIAAEVGHDVSDFTWKIDDFDSDEVEINVIE